jgi:chemotaxis signal transduction protein
MTQNTEKAKTNGQVVVFTLGEEKYGIEISSVKEIVKWTKITELPCIDGESRNDLRNCEIAEVLADST